MYITRFVRKDDKPNEEYFYITKEAALRHMMLFTEDDSNLYRNISVLDEETNTVLAVIAFEGKRIPKLFHIGSKVQLVEAWVKPEELDNIYEITNLNERTERAIICCLTSTMNIKSTEMVGFEMIKPCKS